jgi:hypothetical protein
MTMIGKSTGQGEAEPPGAPRATSSGDDARLEFWAAPE